MNGSIDGMVNLLLIVQRVNNWLIMLLIF
jgi:hypothetical protein